MSNIAIQLISIEFSNLRHDIYLIKPAVADLRPTAAQQAPLSLYLDFWDISTTIYMKLDITGRPVPPVYVGAKPMV